MSMDVPISHQLFLDGGPYHIKTSPLICRVNQWTGYYMIETYVMKELRNPVDTGRKLNVHKIFRKRPGRLLNVLCTFNLRPVSTEKF